MDFLIGKLLILPGVLIGLALHEFSHALAADKLGDPTPRMQGRLTIEPWPHLDLVGFIAIMLIGFGWAKPVQIASRYFKKPKRDDIIVSLAGPIANLLLAIIFGGIVYVLAYFNVLQGVNGAAQGFFWVLLYYVIWINIILFIFNLFPIPPLVGSHILTNLLPIKQAEKFAAFGSYSMIILLILMFTGIFSFLLEPPAKLVYSIILGMFGLPDALHII